jgi:hypothetical protein
MKRTSLPLRSVRKHSLRIVIAGDAEGLYKKRTVGCALRPFRLPPQGGVVLSAELTVDVYGPPFTSSPYRPHSRRAKHRFRK